MHVQYSTKTLADVCLNIFVEKTLDIKINLVYVLLESFSKITYFARDFSFFSSTLCSSASSVKEHFKLFNNTHNSACTKEING